MSVHRTKDGIEVSIVTPGHYRIVGTGWEISKNQHITGNKSGQSWELNVKTMSPSFLKAFLRLHNMSDPTEFLKTPCQVRIRGININTEVHGIGWNVMDSHSTLSVKVTEMPGDIAAAVVNTILQAA